MIDVVALDLKDAMCLPHTELLLSIILLSMLSFEMGINEKSNSRTSAWDSCYDLLELLAMDIS